MGELSDLIRFLETVYVFHFLLAFYFRNILILYAADFNPRINKDIILYYKKSLFDTVCWLACARVQNGTNLKKIIL